MADAKTNKAPELEEETFQEELTDNRLEPINVKPTSRQAEIESQKETNEVRQEDERQRFFRRMTQLNPSSRWAAKIQAMTGTPGNQSPKINEMFVEAEKQDPGVVKETAERETLADVRGRSTTTKKGK